MMTRTNVLLSLVSVLLLGGWMLDRLGQAGRIQESKKAALEDSLVRQLAVVERDHTHLVEGFILATRQEEVRKLDRYLFFVSSEQLARFAKYEKDINKGQAERASVSGKRLLEALDCEAPDDFIVFAKNVAPQELDQETLIGFLGLDSSTEYERFMEFLETACNDVVSRNEVDSAINNAPNGELRVL